MLPVASAAAAVAAAVVAVAAAVSNSCLYSKAVYLKTSACQFICATSTVLSATETDLLF